MTTNLIGQPVSRVDGRQKVTGTATYAAEFALPRMAHGALVRSTVARGRIASRKTEFWLAICAGFPCSSLSLLDACE